MGSGLVDTHGAASNMDEGPSRQLCREASSDVVDQFACATANVKILTDVCDAVTLQGVITSARTQALELMFDEAGLAMVFYGFAQESDSRKVALHNSCGWRH